MLILCQFCSFSLSFMSHSTIWIENLEAFGVVIFHLIWYTFTSIVTRDFPLSFLPFFKLSSQIWKIAICIIRNSELMILIRGSFTLKFPLLNMTLSQVICALSNKEDSQLKLNRFWSSLCMHEQKHLIFLPMNATLNYL